MARAAWKLKPARLPDVCSYLGLEHHPALIRGVHDAVDRWGTQFSASRGYVSAPPYEALEEHIGR
mgnify:CR=1 FL=1